MPVPVVCAVNGVAAGAGANIALLCDLVVAKSSASFIQSFARIGLVPDSGGTWTLPRLVGHARAMALALTGEPLDAVTAAAWGLIWKAVPDDRFAEDVEALVAALARAPTAGLVETKRAIRAAWSDSLGVQLDNGQKIKVFCFFSSEKKAFLHDHRRTQRPRHHLHHHPPASHERAGCANAFRNVLAHR
jgi:2-(1,2-epoxy-1,2-dihydrophenyl)acetyl-CoA isomerase